MDTGFSVGIIGLGRLGSTLAVALHEAGVRVSALAARSREAADALASRLGPATAATDSAAEVVDRADLVFLTVRDAGIRPLYETLPWSPRNIAVHCSGSLTLDVLSTAASRGASSGCMHPLQSFPSGVPDPGRFRGITCGVEGDFRAVTVLTDIAGRLGSRVVRLDGVDRALYHAAAVFAANCAVALMSYASSAWEMAGLPAGAAREALAPLLQGASSSIGKVDLPLALTGPIVRGDTETVARHVEALAADQRLLEAYRMLGRELLRVVNTHSTATRSALDELLSGPAAGR